MAFTGSFTAVQSTDLKTLIIVDASSGGTDPNIISRYIYLYKIDGTTLVPTGTTTAYINFPIVAGVGDTINLAILLKDYSLNILIVWTSTVPITGAVYQKTILFTATGNSNNAMYGIIQNLSANPNLLNETSYFNNLSKLQVNIDSAIQSQLYSDQFSAQSALDRAYLLTSNKAFNF